jgi:hypothetical protein
MFRDIVEQFRFDGPSEKVQLTDGGQERFVTRNLEQDPLTATVRVEVLLRICLQLGFIRHIYKELVAVEIISHEILATVVCDKPVN